MKVYRYVATAEDNGVRLDHFLAARTTDFSRGRIRKMIDIGGVHVDGRRVRSCSLPVKTGMKIELYDDGFPLDLFSIEDSHIVYRDKYLLAIDKPPGIETQPTPARFKGTLYEALQRFLVTPARPLDKPSLGMVQRLDRETSGVIVFSIHPSSHRALTEIFSGREVEKIYLALVQGRMENEQGEIRSLLAKNRASNRMRSVQRGGKEAITRYRVLDRYDDCSLLEVTILTGRSHQIRVHFSEAGHPLLGDRLYGSGSVYEGKTITRQMLHAWKLRFRHPRTAADLVFEAPLPADLVSLIDGVKDSGRWNKS